MRPVHLRFVGAVELPRSLSDFDVEQSFRLFQSDIGAIRKAFRTDRRLGAALQLVVLRATGRPLDKTVSVPRALLRSLCISLGIGETTIASLRTLYSRVATLYEHQTWARNFAGLTEASVETLNELSMALATLATTAASVDELVEEAQLWLFARQHLLPVDRVLRDLSRKAFSAAEACARQDIDAEISAGKQAAVLAAVHSSRRGRTGGSVLEWLKTPAGRHSPTSISEVTEKITWLKQLGVDQWSLNAISSTRLRAYAQAVMNRPPSESRRRGEETQILEVICFLRVTLLDLTDTLMYLTGRRVNDLVRHASNRVVATQVRSAGAYRQQHEAMRAIVYDDDRSAEDRISALKKLLPKDERPEPATHAGLVRQALTEDDARITALLNAFSDLDIRGRSDQRPLKQVAALRALVEDGAKELPIDFDVSVAEPVWHDLLKDPDRGRALVALKAATMLAVRQGLRGGRLWVDHSWEFRNREDLLIPLAQWKEDRQILISALRLTTDAQKYLARLQANLDVGLRALSEAVDAGKLEIDADGMPRLHKLEALPVDAAVQRSRDAMFAIIGQVQFGDLIVEVDACSGFSEELLGRRARSAQELIACYAALLAHGTENDARGVAAMVPGLEVAHITAAMRSLEARGRLRRANERVVQFQRQQAIAQLWGSGEKASADMMALDASRYLYTARVDPRRRTHAVGLYTHVLETYGIVYDQPIVHNERQSSAALEGVEQYNARSDESTRLSLLAVDTHGYTYVGMAMAKLLGFDLCPRLRDIAERRLYLPRAIHPPENIEHLALARVSEAAIAKGWDELLGLVASIRSGRVSPRAALERLGSAAQGDPMHKAADHLGRLLRTLFLCDYFSNEEFRREIHTLLNRGESVHLLQRAIYYGRLAAERGRRRDEMRAISGSHTLLTNIVLAWNTLKMQSVVDNWRKQRHPIEDAWVRRMGPVHFGHVNFRGLIAFGVERYADALLHRPAPRRPAATGE
jgi:TnpA family transposase